MTANNKRSPLQVFLAIALALINTAPTAAQGLLETFTQAKAQSPTYRSQQHTQRAMEAAGEQAMAAYLPQLSLNYQYGHNWQEVVDAEHAIFPEEKTDFATQNTSLQLSQSLYDGPKLAQIRRAEAQVQVSKLELAEGEQTLIVQVAESYFGLLAAEDNLRYSEAEYKAAESQARLAQAKFDKGLVNRVELQEVMARKAEAQAMAVEANQLRIEAAQTLMMLTGESPETLHNLPPQFPFEEVERAELKVWLERALANNTALKARRESLRAAHAGVSARRSAHYPKLELNLSYTRDDTDGSLYGGGNEIDTRLAQLRLSVPLYSGGGTQAALRQSREEMFTAEQQLVDVERGIKRTVHAAWHGIDSALARMEATSESVAAYEVALRAKRSGYASGLFSAIEVLDAERSYAMAQKEAARSRYDYVLNLLRLKQAAGELDGTVLTQVDRWLQP